MIDVVFGLSVLLLAVAPDPWLAESRAGTGDTDACRDAWASHAAREPPPAGLSLEEQARLRAAGSGLFVTASLTQDELQVSIIDPLGVVARVRAEALGAEARVLLRKPGPPERLVFARPAETTDFEVLVYARDCLPKRPLHRLSLSDLPIPAPPDPVRAAARLAPPVEAAPPAIAPIPAGETFPWWWIVGAAVVGLGVGAAAWEELR